MSQKTASVWNREFCCVDIPINCFSLEQGPLLWQCQKKTASVWNKDLCCGDVPKNCFSLEQGPLLWRCPNKLLQSGRRTFAVAMSKKKTASVSNKDLCCGDVPKNCFSLEQGPLLWRCPSKNHFQCEMETLWRCACIIMCPWVNGGGGSVRK